MAVVYTECMSWPSEGSSSRGFTLIELLIVIAILGVLAVVVLVAIDPVEKLANARDAGRISSTAQLGRSLQSYYTSSTAYPLAANWAQDLIDAGELSVFPAGVSYNTVGQCTIVVQPAIDPTYCYSADIANGALVYSRAESERHSSKCSLGDPYFVFSTADGRGGTVCSALEPTVWAAGTQTYVD